MKLKIPFIIKKLGCKSKDNAGFKYRTLEVTPGNWKSLDTYLDETLIAQFLQQKIDWLCQNIALDCVDTKTGLFNKKRWKVEIQQKFKGGKLSMDEIMEELFSIFRKNTLSDKDFVRKNYLLTLRDQLHNDYSKRAENRKKHAQR